MLTPDDRIERLLRAYEDYWYLIGVWNRVRLALGKSPACRRERAVIHYRGFRKKLLQVQSFSQLDVHDFQQPSDFLQDKPWSLPHLWTLPLMLTSWCKDSRRIYYIKPDLQALLEATSLEGVTWSDVTLPFPSFAVRFGQPIMGEGVSYDYAIVSSFNLIDKPGTWMRIFYLVRSSVAGYQQLSPANRKNIEERIARKQWRHAEEVIGRFFHKVCHTLCNYFPLSQENEADLVLNSAKREYARHEPGNQDFCRIIVPLFDQAVRVIVGMSLYLKTLPAGSPHQGQWKRTSKTAVPDPRAITNEAEVCTVSSCYQLTREERVMLGLEGSKDERMEYNLSCHFREGHWRRPPGQGQNPTAPKTVHVRPTIVRRDRLRPDELPAGTQKIM